MRSTIAALAAAGLLSLGTLAPTSATTLVFGGSDAVGSLLDRANSRFSELVTERTDGEVTVNFISGEQLGSDIDVIQQMMQGSVALYGDVLGWYANWVQDFNILNWGFTFDDNDHMQAFLDSDVYGALAEQLREEQGIRILAAAPTQPRVLFAKERVETPADLEGLKMRVPEIRTYLLLWETLGTEPSRLAWGEIYLGLQTGTIEAFEGPISAVYSAKTYEVAPEVMRTDHLVSTYHITINDEVFQSLTPEHQEVLVDTAREVTQWAREQAEMETEEILSKMSEEGATIHPVETGPFAEKALSGVEVMEADGVWSEGLWQRIRDLDGQS